MRLQSCRPSLESGGFQMAGLDQVLKLRLQHADGARITKMPGSHAMFLGAFARFARHGFRDESFSIQE